MKTANYLDQILERKKLEVEQLKKENHLHKLLHQTRRRNTKFSSALKKNHLAVIGEVKRRSPSCGEIRHIEDPAALALQYCQGGVSAISVLTDGAGFGGSLADLQQVSRTLASQYPDVAILRKDFIIHPLQIAEAVAAGADAILLIANAVGSQLKSLMTVAEQLGLEVLTEIHDHEDLELALAANAPIIGVNHRNLTTFEVDLSVSNILRPLIPAHVITVAESGIQHTDQAIHLRELGYDAILVGEALVRSKHPDTLIQQMKGMP